MKGYWSFVKTESKRMITAMNIILLGMFFLVAMYFVNNGISAHKRCLKEIDEVKTIERQRITIYNNYKTYGSVGIRLILQPSPVSIFFSDSRLTSQMYASLNCGEILNLERSLKGKNLSENILLGYADFSRLFLIIGSLLFLIYGYKTFEHREYIKMLSTIGGERRIYFSILSTRLTLIILFFLFMLISGILLAYGSGITFAGSEWLLILEFIAALLVVSFIFFIIGVLIGTLNSEKYKTVLAIITWAIFIFLIPLAVSKIINENAQSLPSNTRIELKNWNSMKNFEIRATKEQGEFKAERALSEPVIRIVNTFLTNEYKDMQAAEREIETGMKENSNLFHRISTLTPGTFYLSLTTEMSSQGNNSVVDFFKYAEDTKDKFVRFWFKKKYSPNNKKVESFIKGDENVFKSKSRVPETYWFGMALMFVYAIGLTWFGAYRFHKILHYNYHPVYKGEKKPEPPHFVFNKGLYYVMKSKRNITRNYLYSAFYGKPDQHLNRIADASVHVDNIDITSKPIKQDFLYLVSPQEMPGDIRVKDFLDIVSSLCKIPKKEIEKAADTQSIDKNKLFGELAGWETFDILLNLTQWIKSEVYLVDKSEKGMRIESIFHLIDRMDELSDQNALVVFLYDDFWEPHSMDELDHLYNIDDAEAWRVMFDKARRELKEQ